MIDIERDLTNKELKEYRFAMGLTMLELGKLLGTTKQTISNLERGETNISRVFSISYQFMFEHFIPEDERELRLKIAKLGINYANATEELINLAKNS